MLKVNLSIFRLISIEYANPDLVNNLYEDYRKRRYELDLIRKKRNEHSG